MEKVAEDAIGICPTCKEWTSVKESCCGDGAIVEGDLVTDEDYDPTPYCSGCGSMTKNLCRCGPIAENE